MNLANSSIRQVAIVCGDVTRATAFYRDVLGIPFLFAAGPNLAFFDCGGVRLMLTTSDVQNPRVGTSLLYYLVPDIDAMHRELSSKGVAFGGTPHMIAQMPDHQLWLVDFTDSEGNMLCLMEERR